MSGVMDGVFFWDSARYAFCLMMFSPFAQYPFRDLEDIPEYDGGAI
jgi:hypothetical protein